MRATCSSAVLALALVAGVVGGAWWWRHPRAFHAAPTSPSLGLGEVRAATSQPLHVAMQHPMTDADGSVVLTGAEPHVVSNRARANPIGTPRPQVIMTIQATRPGEVRVQGIDLSYQYGHQSGTQRVGQYVWLEYD